MASLKIVFLCTLVLVAAVMPSYGKFFILDDREVERAAPQNEAAASEARIRRDGGDGHGGVTGPVHTYVKTDKHANFKWGVRHHVGHQYSG